MRKPDPEGSFTDRDAEADEYANSHEKRKQRWNELERKWRKENRNPQRAGDAERPTPPRPQIEP